MIALAAKRPADAAGFTRRGACPALSAPMPTGDGLLVRLNPVAGGLSPAQLAGLCEAAQMHGNGVIEVTARGSVQVRGLTPASAAQFAEAVDRLGIAVRTGVPVQTSVLAGLNPQEIVDPMALAEMIRTGIAEAGLEGRLGPKVSVVVDGGGRSALEEVAADVRLTTVRDGGSAAWQIAIAGGARTAKTLGVVHGDEAACDAVLGLLSRIAKMGRVARARDLSGESLPALPSSSRHDGVEGASLIGTTSLRNTYRALGIALPFGHTTAKLLKAFAETAQKLGIGDIRPAPGRTLVAICGTAAQAEELRKAAEAFAFVTSPDDPRLAVSACPGAPDCASGHMPARQLATKITNEYSGLLDSSVHLHVSGCAKGCAHPAASGLVLVGTETGMGLIVEGTARNEPLAFAENDRAGRALANVAKLVSAERRPGETTAQAIKRIGFSVLAEAFGRGGK